ncbi:MAG: CDP-glycerol glycerophosphotransferase family protein [Candidatus Reddybacter sp.]
MKTSPARKKIVNLIRSIDDRLHENTKKTKILFVYVNSHGFSCQVPIIEALSKVSNIQLHITTDKAYKVDESNFANKKEYDIFKRYYIPFTRAIYKKWHLYIDSHVNSFFPRRNALHIGMHHGPGFGIMGRKIKLVKNYDIFFGLSQAERIHFEKIEPGIFDQERAFFPIGFPKSDILVQKSYPQHDIRKKLKLKDRATILIASHWETVSILRNFGHNIFESLCKTFPDYNIIQTGHPWIWEGYRQDAKYKTRLVKELNAIQQRFENAYFLPNPDTEQLLQASDILISDHSSILTTYSLLDRPIIWYENPELRFSIPKIRNIYQRASDTFHTIDELPRLCQQALAKPEKNSSGREVMRQTYFANPGQAGIKAAETLCKIGSICSTKSPRWQSVIDESREYSGNSQSTKLSTDR